jgi:hypothetical protein
MADFKQYYSGDIDVKSVTFQNNIFPHTNFGTGTFGKFEYSLLI